MQFLDEKECRVWAGARHFPLGERPFSVLADEPPFVIRKFAIPKDAGARIALVGTIWDGIGRGQAETLIWITDWSIWPSSEHMPLAKALRTGLGEKRPLFDAPGCLARLGEDDDALSVIIVSVLFLWDCWLLAANGRLAAFFSHDEYGILSGRGIIPDELIHRLSMMGVLVP